MGMSDAAVVSEPGTVTAARPLVLSLFPGADLLGRGFEAEGFCVVRGPDILWGQDVRDFAPARHKFTGIIGGSPCQDFSKARRCAPTGEGLELLRQFVRVVDGAGPGWYLLENVPGVPDVAPLFEERGATGWTVQRTNVNAKEVPGCAQNRLRCFQFGWRDGLGPLVIHRGKPASGASPCAMATEGKRQTRRTFADFCELQGLPRDFALPGLTLQARYRAVGNGVPIPLARAVAAAVARRTGEVQRLCICQCGRAVPAGRTLAAASCRKRMQRRRDLEFVTGRPPPADVATLPGL